MSETFDSSAEKPSPWDHPSDEHKNKVARWKENLKDNLFIVLLGSAAISFLAGYFIAQQQEARNREQWGKFFSDKPRTG